MKTIEGIIEFFKGKKTYIAGLITAGFNLAIAFGWLGELTAIQIIATEGFLGSLIGISIRLGMGKKMDYIGNKTIVAIIFMFSLALTSPIFGQGEAEGTTPTPRPAEERPTPAPTAPPGDMIDARPGTNIREFSARAINAERWFFAYDPDAKVFHWGQLTDRHVVATGQPILEIFRTEEELRRRVDSIAGSGYYDERQEERE